jgi:hypothetical protein
LSAALGCAGDRLLYERGAWCQAGVFRVVVGGVGFERCSFLYCSLWWGEWAMGALLR